MVADTPKSTEERILVCVGPSPSSAALINFAWKTAAALGTRWFAVHVEGPGTLMLPEAERNRAADNLRLAERLGGETATLTGRDVAREIIEFARARGVTRIVVGKPGRPLWQSLFLRNPVDRLVRMSEGIDVCVTSGEPGGDMEAEYRIRPRKIQWPDYGTAFLFFVLATVLCFMMYTHFDLSNLIMVYLLGVTVTAMGCGRGPAVLVSVLSVLSFDFFFVPPRFSFTVDESQYIVTFIVMLVVALAISHLTTLMRQQTMIARLQEKQAAAMHGLSRQLVTARGVERILNVAVQYISEIFDSKVVVLVPDEKGKLKVAAGDLASVLPSGVVKEISVARSAYDTGKPSGLGGQVSPGGEVLYVPLRAADFSLGVLALRPEDPERFLLPDQSNLVESLTNQVALALEVEHLAGDGTAK
jgi:two-component system, OmpR family, sensor histidine kinase KdpD